ncbi:MAG: DNA mismatch repair endonuclease MutL [Bacilli bacterium]|nr:DNA mismatch repair endonuclease MutL [Bacilli bacterium]MBN2696853.1 DNA mismatch repair endonuclease MutL [Bacilli bacterium]
MGKIKLLDPKLQNLIAAGEVIERIANVVKELVENSLDANAKRIDILLDESGFKSITVQDDGIGMEKDDALMAFSRHATSKIGTEYDLFHISTLGFRGEALPSIASVARVELKTATNETEGFKVVVQDGHVKEQSVIPPIQGTRIQVSRLFYHTPARFKYLKSPQTELSYVIDTVNRLALANPDIAFVLSNNGKRLLSTFGSGKTAEVIGAVYGFEVAKSLTEFSAANRDYRIRGHFANPIHNRASRNVIAISVNKRPIRDNRLVSSVIEAFAQLVPIHRYPLVALDIEVDPQLVDVNVHPTKNEVRFSELENLRSLIRTTLSKSLNKTSVIQRSHGAHEVNYQSVNSEEVSSVYEQDTLFAFDSSELVESQTHDSASFPDFDYIGQYRGTYLLYQNDFGLYLLDQHAAAERIRYERYLDKMSRDSTTSYELLVPLSLEIGNEIAAKIDETIIAKLAELNISLQSIDSGSFAVKKVPDWFPKGMELVYIDTVLTKLTDNQSTDKRDLRDELAKLLACKHSLKANAYVSHEEADELVKSLKQCRNPYTCPHGRPIMVLINNIDVEKWFKRIQ